ncbi:MAG: endonuclease/exonuclease/phosphatase family protein [Acidimicrobiia bacterium]
MAELTIASFNLHWGGLRPNGEPFDVVGACRTLDADILVLQEVWWPTDEPGMLSALAADHYAMHALHEHPLARDIERRGPKVARDGTGDWGVAVFTRFPVLVSRDLELGDVPGDLTKNRTALHLQLNVEGTPFDLVAMHLSANVVYGPTLQLRRIRAQLPENRPAVLVGDFNLGPRAVSLMLRHWRPAVTGPTWPAPRQFVQLDHILVSEEVTVVHGEVCPDMGSDHRPVRARLAFDPNT